MVAATLDGCVGALPAADVSQDKESSKTRRISAKSDVFVQSKWHGYRGGCSTTKL